MDKYEYRIKTEQMLAYVDEKAYKKAMEIADTIDWRRVKSISMLCTVSEIYENNSAFQKSRDVLFLAYDKSPGSRKIVYRLGVLALKLGDIKEARDCYDEFVELAPKDPNQFILRYKILTAQEAPIKARIEALATFKKAEYVEKWAFELAKLYHEAGMTAECLAECDDLILWFSDGQYVYQAMELKMLYKPLTPAQQEKYSQRYNQSKRVSTFGAPRMSQPRPVMQAAPASEPKTGQIEGLEVHTGPLPRVPSGEKQDFYQTGTMQIEEILQAWEKTQKKLSQEFAEEKMAQEKESLSEAMEERKNKVKTLSNDIKRLLAELEAEEKGEVPTFGNLDYNRYEEEELQGEEVEELEEEDDLFENKDTLVKSLFVLDDEEEQPKDELSDQVEEENLEEEPAIEEASCFEENPSIEEVEQPEPKDFFDEEGEELLADEEGEDLSEEELLEEDSVTSFEDIQKEENGNDYDDLVLTLEDAIDFDEQDEVLRQEYLAEQSTLELSLEEAEDFTVDDSAAEEIELEESVEEELDADEEDQGEEACLDEEELEEESLEETAGEEFIEEIELTLDEAEKMDEPDAVDEIEEIEEEVPILESQDTQSMIKRSPGGVVLDTAFVVQGRYDLEAQSEIGIRAGLTEEQKKLFSYFVPVRGMSEQLVQILHADKHCHSRKGTSCTGNILVMGHKGNGKTVLAVDIVKAIQKQRNIAKGKVGIITGSSLNKKDVADMMQKLHGGALIIERAGLMDGKTISTLNACMEEQTGEMLVILEDQKRGFDRMMRAFPSFRKKFTSRVELPIFINDELVTFGQTYAKENGYRIDEIGILALYSRIDLMQTENHYVTVAEVKEVMDEAFARAKKSSMRKTMKRMFGKNTDESDRIILQESDFKL